LHFAPCSHVFWSIILHDDPESMRTPLSTTPPTCTPVTRVTRSYSKSIIIIFTILHAVNFSASILFSLVLFLLLLICFANWGRMSCHVTLCTGLRSCRAMLVTCEMTTSSTSVTIQTLRLITSVTPFGFAVFFYGTNSCTHIAFDLLRLCLRHLQRSSNFLRFC